MALPSSTVENYLKAIFQAQLRLARRTDLVPMGEIAAALGVVPGTATTMVKTLADSGLAK
jgi:DtxR family Mn-dependent transcriptional regulator